MAQATELIANEVAKVLSENDTYNSYKDRWRYLLESYIGGDEYRNAGHLIRYATESAAEYQSRLRSTPLDNHCQSVVSVYTSFLFKDTPYRKLDAIESNVFFNDFMRDCDFEGRTLDHFMKDLSIWASVFGHAWMMVIKPNVGAAPQADEFMVGARPYLTQLTPLVVIDWEWERLQTGKYELAYFKYIEDINGDVYTVKEWTQDTVKTSVVDSVKRTFVQAITIEENSLGFIPAVICYNKRSSVRGIGVSDIKDIADQQRFIYNAKSEAQQSIMLNTHPSLVKTANTLAGIGAGSIIQMDESMDPALKPYLLEFNGASIESIYKSIDQAETMIDKIANTGAIRSTESVRMSGVAQEQEFQMLNAKLSDKSHSIELAEEQMWQMWSVYQNVDYTGTIVYPNSFNIRDSKHDLEMIMNAATLMIPSDKFKKEMAKQVVDLIVEDEAQVKAIRDEIDQGVGSEFNLMPTALDGEPTPIMDEDDDRQYPDGSDIDPRLPDAYQPATNAEVPQGQNCLNCAAYNTATGACSIWYTAFVRPNYWCARWEGVEQ